MVDFAVDSLRKLCDQHGRKEVAETIGANEQTLYQIVTAKPLPSGRARGVGRTLRERLDRAFPGWMTPSFTATEPPPHFGGPQSHSARHPDHSFDAPLLSYGSIMKNGVNGTFFRTIIDDEACAPDLPQGAEILWQTTRLPKPGRYVLVQDAHGRVHVRQYRQGRDPGQWIAAATNQAYASLDSAADGLRILGVKRAVMDPGD